jgi:CHAD domain-containing protein
MASNTPNEAAQVAPPSTLREALHLMLANAETIQEHGSDKIIHAARKEMKRARAALRLLRPALGDPVYRRANSQVRDAARLLTPLRDATVLLDSLKFVRRSKDKRTHRIYANHLQYLLTDELRSSHGRLMAESLMRSAAILQALDRHIAALPAQESDRLTASQEIQKVYKAGRKALARAKRHVGTGSLHEWRKESQYLSNQAELIRTVFHVKLKKIGRRSRKLARLLGEDHDLALLRQKIQEVRSGKGTLLDGGAFSRFKRRIQRRRDSLQSKAFRLGKRLYARKRISQKALSATQG